jgi:hypothetical protein
MTTMTTNPARLTPDEVGIIEWTRLRAGSGMVALASDFYEWFFDTEWRGADRTRIIADDAFGAGSMRSPAPWSGTTRPWVNFGAPVPHEHAFRLRLCRTDVAGTRCGHACGQ